MSSNDFEVNFKISEPPAETEADLKIRADKAEARCTELSERLAELKDRLGEHMVRASSLSAMREEASRAWVRVGKLERQCGELTRKNEELEKFIDAQEEVNEDAEIHTAVLIALDVYENGYASQERLHECAADRFGKEAADRVFPLPDKVKK